MSTAEPEPFTVQGQLHDPSINLTIVFPGITVDFRITEDGYDHIDEALAALPEAVVRTLALMQDGDDEEPEEPEVRVVEANDSDEAARIVESQGGVYRG